MTIAIGLTQGKIAQVDDIDADFAALRWCAQKSYKVFYASRHIRLPDGRRAAQYLHRVIAERMGIVGKVDHRNRDGLDCRRENLRVASTLQNNVNQGMRTDNTSGVKGVTWNRFAGKWEAQLRASGRRRFIGRFDDLDAARSAVEAARRELHGAFACNG